jgi:hypothetical protein
MFTQECIINNYFNNSSLVEDHTISLRYKHIPKENVVKNIRKMYPNCTMSLSIITYIITTMGPVSGWPLKSGQRLRNIKVVPKVLNHKVAYIYACPIYCIEHERLERKFIRWKKEWWNYTSGKHRHILQYKQYSNMLISLKKKCGFLRDMFVRTIIYCKTCDKCKIFPKEIMRKWAVSKFANLQSVCLNTGKLV